MERLSLLTSHFESVPLEAPDAIFGIAGKFREDPAETKVDLVVGAYRTDEGKPWVLPAVKMAEDRLLQEHRNHEYLPLDGLKEFTQAATAVCLGSTNPAITENRYVAVQALSGTGALRVSGEFLKKFYPYAKTIYLPTPTWPNHKSIFEDAGLEVKYYRYYDNRTIDLDFEGLIQDLRVSPFLSSFSSFFPLPFLFLSSFFPLPFLSLSTYL